MIGLLAFCINLSFVPDFKTVFVIPGNLLPRAVRISGGISEGVPFGRVGDAVIRNFIPGEIDRCRTVRKNAVCAGTAAG